MQKIQNKAFTIVELIVVVAILSILSTIGIISYRAYIIGVRDANRVTQIIEIRNAIERLATTRDILLPEKSVEVRVNWKVIAYQWYLWQDILNQLSYNKWWWVDPKDNNFFTYYVSSHRKYFQLLTFLENLNDSIGKVASNSMLSQVYAFDYTERFPKLVGNTIWVLTQTGTNTPIQEIDSIIWSGYLDIGTTNDEFVAHLWDTKKISWTWTSLSILEAIVAKGSINSVPISCKKILSLNPSLKNKNGNYEIYTLKAWKKLSVYCDMTTDWGGWTRYVNIKWSYDYNDAKDCIDEIRDIDNSNLFCINPWGLGDIKEYLYKDNTTNIIYQTIIDKDYIDGGWGRTSIYNRTLFDRMYGWLNYYTRLWINYDHNHTKCWTWRHPWWAHHSWDYMNFDYNSSCSWPLSWSRQWSPSTWEFYVR